MDLEAWIIYRDKLNELHTLSRKAPVFDDVHAVIEYVFTHEGVTLKGVYDTALYAEAQIKHLGGKGHGGVANVIKPTQIVS